MRLVVFWGLGTGVVAGGQLADGVCGSSAIPGLFEPFRLDDHVLIDGGWAEPVPVNVCHHVGAIHVVAVDVAERGALLHEDDDPKRHAFVAN